MDNTPTNQPNETGNETPENTIPTPTETPTETPQEAPLSTPAETSTIPEPSTDDTPVTNEVPVEAPVEAPTTPESTPESTESTTSAEPAAPATPTEPTPAPEPVTATAATTPATTPISNQNSTAPSGSAKKSGLPVGLIIGLAIGGVILFGAAITTVILLFFGSKVDYEATYKSFDAIEDSMDDISYGNCYKVHSRIDSSYTSSSDYSEYVTGCVEELVALESATSEFAKTSGVKHDENIKKAFETFQSDLKAIYTKKSDLESQLSVYNAYHEFYLTFKTSSSDVKNLENSIISAASILEDTKNSTLTDFAKGFRERGLAYVRAIDDYRNGSGTSYSDVYDKMEEFTDYIEDNAPEVVDVTGLDFTKMNELSDAYYNLSSAVRDAYYDHI